MLIKQIALMLLALEGLIAWCWILSPAETEVLILAHLSIVGGIAVAGYLRARATVGVPVLWQRQPPAPPAMPLKKAA